MSGDPPVRSSTDEPECLFWFDGETTCLDPQRGHFLEISFLITSFRYPYRTWGRNLVAGTYLVEDPPDAPHPDTQGSVVYGLPPRIFEMHTASGLLRDLKEKRRTSLRTIEDDLLQVSEGWPSDRDRMVRLAGFSIGQFDLPWIRHHLPRFAERLSLQVFDATSIYTFCRSLGMPRSGKKTEAIHRAKDDILAALERTRASARWLAEESYARSVASNDGMVTVPGGDRHLPECDLVRAVRTCTCTCGADAAKSGLR